MDQNQIALSQVAISTHDQAVHEAITRCDLDNSDQTFELRKRFFYATKEVMHKFVNPKHNDPEEPPEIPDDEREINVIRKTNF